MVFNLNSDHAHAGIAHQMYDGEPMEMAAGTCGYAMGDVSEVAGYPVRDIWAYFACVPGADGLLTGDSADTALYFASYHISPPDPEAAAEDLTQKLCRLYGEMDLSHEDKDTILWHGAEGTMVALWWQGGNEIYIRYGFEGGDKLLRAAQAAAEFAFSQNVDGL